MQLLLAVLVLTVPPALWVLAVRRYRDKGPIVRHLLGALGDAIEFD